MREAAADATRFTGTSGPTRDMWQPPPGSPSGAGRFPGWQSQLECWRAQLTLVGVVTGREIRDTLRDWRMVVPITLLTLVFPVVLNFAANVTLNFVRQYNANTVGEQAIPFMLLVVGFFPISFSLVIALETFVGEKERKSLEPLLATPLSNTQLYLGKTLAALVPPVVASYLGITVYLASMYLLMDFRPDPVLVIQILLLTTAEAVVMVSGAVIISSQTTSVRAANLLASFIILPMAFLLQAEAILMFWARYEMLWFVLLALLVGDVILIRMGVRIFRREELLGRAIDELNLRQSWRYFKESLLTVPASDSRGSAGEAASGKRRKRSLLLRFYRNDVPGLLRLNRPALAVVLVGLAGAIGIGWRYAARYPLPAELLSLEGVSRESFSQFDGSGILPSISTWQIFSHNVRALLAAGLLSMLSFGSLAIALLMAPIAILGFVAVQAAMAGYNPLLFLGVFILPHGVFELPAAILATALAVRLGIALVAPPLGLTVSQSWLQALAHFIKLFLLVVLPLLAVAALIEATVTPQLVIAVYAN